MYSILKNIFIQKSMIKSETFFEKYTHDERLAESKKIMARYRTSIPVIVEPKDESVRKIDKTKFLVPKDLTFGQFMYVVRKRLALRPEQSIFMFCKGTLPTSTETIYNIHKTFGASDGFLYIKYAFENTFG